MPARWSGAAFDTDAVARNTLPFTHNKEEGMARKLMTLVVFILLSIAVTASAQDLAKVAPKNVKVLLDNAEVRVLEYTSAKGEKIALHSHPPYVVYALAPGKTHFTMPDGKTRDLDVQAGQATWSDGGAHTQESITDNHVIVFEIKHAKPLAAPPTSKKK